MKKQNDITRRNFVANSIKGSLAIPFLSSGILSCNTKEQGEETVEGSTKKLNILILGGTSFLGPHQIAYALSRGHAVTTFTRGKTLPSVHQDLFQQVTSLVGDRESDLSALETGEWDVVIDNSGHRTAWTERTAQLLKDRTELYVYTSSTGVYYPYLSAGADENSTVLLVEPEGITDEDEKIEYWYGVMKATSENAVRAAYGNERTIVVRPTYMIGPADKSNRFIHWPVRLAKGGEILVPGQPDDPVQYADVRDVAEFTIRLIESRSVGTYNAVGPAQTQGMLPFIQQISQGFDIASSFVSINDYDFLQQQGILHLVPWIMPTGKNMGSALISNEKGIQAGLSFRDPVQTVQDTYHWWYSGALTDEQRNKFERDETSVLMREEELLAAWKAHAD